MPNIVYADDFDKEHYPILDRHKDLIKNVEEQFKIAMGTVWHYQATLHGLIFWTEFGRARFTPDDFKFLVSIEGLRWFEGDGKHIKIAVEHVV